MTRYFNRIVFNGLCVFTALGLSDRVYAEGTEIVGKEYVLRWSRYADTTDKDCVNPVRRIKLDEKSGTEFELTVTTTLNDGCPRRADLTPPGQLQPTVVKMSKLRNVPSDRRGTLRLIESGRNVTDTTARRITYFPNLWEESFRVEFKDVIKTTGPADRPLVLTQTFFSERLLNNTLIGIVTEDSSDDDPSYMLNVDGDPLRILLVIETKAKTEFEKILRSMSTPDEKLYVEGKFDYIDRVDGRGQVRVFRVSASGLFARIL